MSEKIARPGYRAGHYDRKLTTTSGDVTLKVPKLKGVPFETARKRNSFSQPYDHIPL